MKGKFEWIMAIIAFISIVVFKINVMILIAGGGVIGILWYSYNSRKLFASQKKGE
jgi:hypothetical protein